VVAPPRAPAPVADEAVPIFRPAEDEESTDRVPVPSGGDPDPYAALAIPQVVNGHQPYPDIEVPVQYPVPTADELAARRVVRPREWVATTGMRAAARRGTLGLVRLRPDRRERQARADVTAVRRPFGGLRQVTIVNPKGGAGKTVATLMLGLTFGQTRGGFVLAWDNNETQGTLGMRAQAELHGRTVRDLLRDLHRFSGAGGRIGELAAYVRPQDGAAFDVLASDEGATAGEMLTATAFREIRDVVGRFYKLLLVDTGNNVRADNWQAAVDASDQLVVTMSTRNDSAETAARLLDHLDQIGRRELVRRAVAVVTTPPHRQDADPRVIERHFEQRCRIVLRVPYDRHLDSGAPVDYPALSPESRRAWLRVAAAVADGL
jgi:MinD-like ATPase involved in chromosome partitioning or flagellar assembly